MPAKAYVVSDGFGEDERPRVVTLTKAIADRMIELDSSLSYEEFELSFTVPVRTTVYVLSGEPGEEPNRTSEILCWPWDSFLELTVTPNVIDRRIHSSLLSPLLEQRMVQRVFGLAELPPPPPTIVVRCQSKTTALEAYRKQAGL